MPSKAQLEPTIIIIFGAGGDLTRRKLVPALYNLLLDEQLPERFAIVGVARKSMENEPFRQRLREGIDQFSRRGVVDESSWSTFANSISYLSENLTDPVSGLALSARLAAIEEEWGLRANRVYYLAIPPTMMKPAAVMLQRLGVCRDCTHDRLVTILDAWESETADGSFNYVAGTWGPEAAELMIARNGHNWLQPTHLEES